MEAIADEECLILMQEWGMRGADGMPLTTFREYRETRAEQGAGAAPHRDNWAGKEGRNSDKYPKMQWMVSTCAIEQVRG